MIKIMSTWLLNDPLRHLTHYLKVNCLSSPCSASAFLKYVCPECDFTNQTLQVFSEHAVENHSKAKVLFSPENIAKRAKLSIVKSEILDEDHADESFEYENFDFDFNYGDYSQNELNDNIKTEIKEFDTELPYIENQEEQTEETTEGN